MKKFFITLIILIILGGVVFFFGWIQIQLPPESYAVVFTKTNGFEKDVIKSGEFVWKWQRLIPTNFTKYVFTLSPQAATFTEEGDLPSSDTYTATMQGNPRFTWRMRIHLAFQIKPESLPTLLEEKKIHPDQIDGYYASVYENAKGYIHPYVIDYIQQLSDRDDTSYDFTALEERLRSQLSRQFPTIEFTDIRIVPLRVPDLALYMQARDNYLKLMELQYRIRSQEIGRITSSQVLENKKIEILREYGKLFTEYPVLLDYLKMKGSLSDLTSQKLDLSEFSHPLTQ